MEILKWTASIIIGSALGILIGAVLSIKFVFPFIDWLLTR